MASWTMSPGFMVSFRLLEMLFMGAQRPVWRRMEGEGEWENLDAAVLTWSGQKWTNECVLAFHKMSSRKQPIIRASQRT